MDGAIGNTGDNDGGLEMINIQLDWLYPYLDYLFRTLGANA
jgi:hypothetical protein